jgi:hypothetical protein
VTARVGTPMPIRAISQYGGPDVYFDTSKLTTKQRSDLQDELKKRNFYAQYLHMEDPMHILIEAEIRQRLEAEQKESQ